MLYYIYDGSYEGLLCTIEQALAQPEPPYAISQEFPAIPPLFCEICPINSHKGKAQRFANFLREKIGRNTPDYLYYANLADRLEAPFWLYEYVKFGLTVGKDLNRYLADERVRRIHQLKREVTGERHRLLGLARFRLLSSGIYYSAITPDHRVLAIMAPHFAARFTQDRWLLHDTKRGWAAIGMAGDYRLLPLDGNLSIAREDDAFMGNLWQQYFAHIAINERQNAKAQANHMPRRYWQNLTEAPGSAITIQQAHRLTTPSGAAKAFVYPARQIKSLPEKEKGST